MTLTMAWIRHQGDTRELLIASDSRLRSGLAWDTCPKLFVTARGDICFGFAGDTMYAYPLILQAMTQMTLHRASRTREFDIHKARGHIKRIIHGMLEQRSDLPVGQVAPDRPETMLLMAGYSWKQRKFVMWRGEYDLHLSLFNWVKASGLRIPGVKNRIVILGDPSMPDRLRAKMIRENKVPTVSAEQDVKKLASERIAKLIAQRNVDTSSAGLDMEPFQVLCSMIRDRVSPYVAGPPQLIKMYPSCSSQIIGVLWPDRQSGQVAICGRPLLHYERLDCPVIDPDTLECSSYLWPTSGSATDHAV